MLFDGFSSIIRSILYIYLVEMTNRSARRALSGEKKTESLNETAIPLYYNGEEVKFIVEEIEDLEHHDEFETP